jgi:hypothetical protein
LEEAEDAFPDEIEAYRGIRNQSSAVSTFITDFHRDEVAFSLLFAVRKSSASVL